jgi:uncharacterized protein (AIM24 family)
MDAVHNMSNASVDTKRLTLRNYVSAPDMSERMIRLLSGETIMLNTFTREELHVFYYLAARGNVLVFSWDIYSQSLVVKHQKVLRGGMEK